MKINIIIVDDHDIFCEGLKALFYDVDDIEVLATANSYEELKEKLLHHQPDMLLLDIAMPGKTGIEITREIKESNPNIDIVILSANKDEFSIVSAVKAGANGYLAKETSKSELVNAIKKVFEGEEYFGKSISETIYRSYKKILRDECSEESAFNLSDREIEVIKLFSEGLSYKEIANRMNISTKTIESHKYNILKKLGLKNTVELVRYAIKNHIVQV